MQNYSFYNSTWRSLCIFCSWLSLCILRLTHGGDPSIFQPFKFPAVKTISLGCKSIKTMPTFPSALKYQNVYKKNKIGNVKLLSTTQYLNVSWLFFNFIFLREQFKKTQIKTLNLFMIFLSSVERVMFAAYCLGLLDNWFND